MGQTRRVLFSRDAWPGLADGSITVTFRRWARAQAKVGSRHRVNGLELEIDAVAQVAPAAISPADARRAGAADREALLRRLAGRKPFGDGELVWRVDFHLAGRDQRRVLGEEAALSAADRAEIDRRLDRLDAARATGPWTRDVLRLIASRPATVSTELAATLGRERAEFKVDVRKLKALGLTESLEVGYRISPRGQAYLDGLAGR
jgi:hypothetical protein